MHVLVITFPAFGHIVPMVVFSRKIAKYHDLTFVISESTYKELLDKELYTDADKQCMTLYVLKDDIESEPQHGGNRSAAAMSQKFINMWDKTLMAVRQLLYSAPIPSDPSGSSHISTPVDVVVGNLFTAEAMHVCVERNIPYYLFNAANTDFVRYCLVLNEDTPVSNNTTLFWDQIGPDGKMKSIAKLFKHCFTPIKTAFPHCKGIIVNSTRELERKTISECGKNLFLTDKPFFCVGPLLPEEKCNAEKAVSSRTLEKWLDGKQGVVFISFGSIASPIPLQVKEIAKALMSIELDRPFVWSLRKTHHECLPEELKNTVGNFDGKGVILPWVDQKMILSHPSVEVFVSHCGWNGTLEGLAGGIPIVCWPLFGDQLTNAKFIAARGAGTVISDGGIDGSVVPAATIVDAIKTAKEKNGETARMWGKEIHMALQPGGTTVKEFQDLITFNHH